MSKLNDRVRQAWLNYMAASKALSKALEDGVDHSQRWDLESEVRVNKGNYQQARAARDAWNRYPPLRCEG